LPDHRPMVSPLLLPLLLLAPDLGLEFTLLVPELGGALEVLVPDRFVLARAQGLELLLQLRDLRRRDLAREPGPRAGLVDHIDRLVREEAVRDVALGEPCGRFQRFVRDDHLVVILIMLAYALQDLDRLLDRRRVDDHGLEAPLQRAILLDVLPVLVQRGGADALELASGQRGLQHVRRAGAGRRVQRAGDGDAVVVLGDVVHDRLEPLLEVAAVLRARDHGRHVKREDPMVPQTLRDLALRDQLRQPLHDRRLPDARLPDQDRVVLLATAQDLHHALDLLLAPDGRVQLRGTRKLRQIPAEVVERRGLALLLALRRGAPARARRRRRVQVAAQELERLRPRLLQGDAERIQDLGRDPLLLPEQAEEQVFRAYVGVVQLPRLGHRIFEHLLRTGSVGQLAQRYGGLPLEDRLLDPFVDLLEVDVQVHEDRRGHPLALPDEAEQDVLRAHVVVLESDRLFPRHREHLADPVREVVIHGSPLSRRRRVPCLGLLRSRAIVRSTLGRRDL